jgi:hypothetical protein
LADVIDDLDAADGAACQLRANSTASTNLAALFLSSSSDIGQTSTDGRDWLYALRDKPRRSVTSRAGRRTRRRLCPRPDAVEWLGPTSAVKNPGKNHHNTGWIWQYPVDRRPQVNALHSTMWTPLIGLTRKGSEVQILYRPPRNA